MIPNTQQVKKHRMRRLNTTIISLGVAVALICLQAILPSYGSGKSELEEKTDAFLKVGDYERAFDLIDGYIQEYPAKSIGYAMLERLLTVGSAYLKDGERERALKLIDSFIQEYPEKPVGRAMLVKVLAPSGRTSDAFKEYYRYYKLSEVISPELLLEIVRGALKNNDQDVRSVAAETLGNLGDKKAVPPLIDVLSEIAPSVKLGGMRNLWFLMSVTDALEKLAGESTVPALIRVFYESDVPVRGQVAGVLGKLKAKSAAPFLIKYLRDDEEGASRWIVEALGELGDARAVPALIDVLNDSLTYDRVRAALALAKLGEERGVSVLIDILNDDGNAAQRRAAAALAEAGIERGVDALIDGLENAWKEVKPLYILPQMGENDMLEAHASFAASYLGIRAAVKLGENGDKRALPVLIGCLNGRYNNTVRANAARTLGAMGDMRAIPALINAFSNDGDYFADSTPLDEMHMLMSEMVRIDAAKALAKLGDERGIPYLMDILAQRDGDYTPRAAIALGELGVKRAEPILIDIIGNNESSDMKLFAAEALVRLSEHRVR